MEEVFNADVYEFKVISNAMLDGSRTAKLATIRLLAIAGWRVGTVTSEGDLILERRIA